MLFSIESQVNNIDRRPEICVYIIFHIWGGTTLVLNCLSMIVFLLHFGGFQNYDMLEHIIFMSTILAVFTMIQFNIIAKY